MTESAENFWENHYGQRSQIWSGRPNAALVDIVSGWPCGTALDLGCGEGADAIWLAQRGWQVHAVDISTTALQRLQTRAESEGVTLTYARHDFAETFPQGSYDLVTAHFLQSPVWFPRDEVLRQARDAVSIGGALVIVDHAASPAWSTHSHDMVFPTPEGTLAALQLGAGWSVEVSEVREREAVSPDGEPATLLDSVVVVRHVG